MKDDLIYKISITLIDGIGDVIAKRLIAYCGGVEAVFKENKRALLKIPNVGITVAESVVTQQVISAAEEEVKFIEKNNVNALFYLDKDYPNRLKYCDDSPVMLYCGGKMDLNKERIISIVGTRRATEYGKKLCEYYLVNARIVQDNLVNLEWIQKHLKRPDIEIRYINKFLGLLAVEIWYRLFITKEMNSDELLVI